MMMIYAIILSICAASPSRVTLCGIGGAIFSIGNIGLAFIGQDAAAKEFGHTGGKLQMCPTLLLQAVIKACILNCFL